MLTGKCAYEAAYNNTSTAQCLQLSAYFALCKKQTFERAAFHVIEEAQIPAALAHHAKSNQAEPRQPHKSLHSLMLLWHFLL